MGNSKAVKAWPTRLIRVLRRNWLLAVAVGVALAGLIGTYQPGTVLGYFREKASPFEIFTLVVFLVLLLPLVFQRLRLPGVVGLLLGGVLLGPYGFGVVEPEWPSVDLFASVGRIFLMFIAGLEIDMRVFRATRQRSMGFGALTFTLPLLAGIAVAWSFDFGWVAAVLVGSLLASHTLLGFPVVNRLGLSRSEPVAVTVGATIFTDIASLLVLAVCISIHKGGFSPMGIALQLGQLAVYAVIVLQGLPLLGRHYFRRHREDEQTLFVFTFLIVMVAAAGAHLIHLEDIVGAFLAGIAVNRLLERSPVREKVLLLGEGLFVPLFFITIGVKLNLPVFAATLVNSLGFVAAIVAALVAGKFLADGDRLITESVLNAVIVLMVLTAVLGPVLTERFGRRMTTEEKTDATS